MVSLAEDLKLALDRVSFAKWLGLVPDAWQEDLLRSTSERVLLNCCRQSGKSTMTGIIALHRALYHPGSLWCAAGPLATGPAPTPTSWQRQRGPVRALGSQLG